MSHVAYAPQMDSPPPRRGHTRTMSNVSTDECVPRRCPPRFREDVVRCVRPSRIDALKTPDPFPYPFPVVLRLMSSPLDSSFGVELGGARPRVGHVRSLSGTLEDITVSAEAGLTAARATSLAVTRETCRRWCVRHSWIPTAVFVLGILLMAAVPGIAILTNRGADPPRVSEVALFVVGDWGREGSVSQNACADAMAAVAPSSAPPSPTPRRVRISASSAPATTSTRMVSPPSMIPRSRAHSSTCTARVRISRRSCGTPSWETTTTAETSPRRSRARRRTRAPANRDGTRCDVDTASSAARRRGTPASSASVSSTPRRGSSDTATKYRGTRTWRRCCVTREGAGRRGRRWRWRGWTRV